jgi:DNA-binding MarR family transcriptional regulator
MIENVKAVNNPLTIIAIFAALAEMAGTVALKIVSPELQATFVWFVMGFPALLVILFFLTLNFNPKVLYAPSDFKDEVNFLNTLGGVRQLSGDLSEVQKQLDGATAKIVEDVVAHIGTANQEQIAQLSKLVDNRIDVVKSQIEKTKESAKDIIDQYSDLLTSQHLHVLDVLRDKDELSFVEIYEQARIPNSYLRHALQELTSMGIVEGRVAIDGNRVPTFFYRISKGTKGLEL